MRSSASISACAAWRLLRCCLSTRIGSFSLYALPLETGAQLREELFMNLRIFTLLIGFHFKEAHARWLGAPPSDGCCNAS
jgi:hypothetical protein